MARLFEIVVSCYGDRRGGYPGTVKTGFRKGDSVKEELDEKHQKRAELEKQIEEPKAAEGGEEAA